MCCCLRECSPRTPWQGLHADYNRRQIAGTTTKPRCVFTIRTSFAVPITYGLSRAGEWLVERGGANGYSPEGSPFYVMSTLIQSGILGPMTRLGASALHSETRCTYTSMSGIIPYLRRNGWCWGFQPNSPSTRQTRSISWRSRRNQGWHRLQYSLIEYYISGERYEHFAVKGDDRYAGGSYGESGYIGRS